MAIRRTLWRGPVCHPTWNSAWRHNLTGPYTGASPPFSATTSHHRNAGDGTIPEKTAHNARIQSTLLRTLVTSCLNTRTTMLIF